MSIEHIPLSQLVPSPRNVRKTGGASIDDLAASIHSHGLLQNLVVSPDGKGKYMVEAGGRRLSALQLLLKADKLPITYEVPCKVLVDNHLASTEASLAENVIRQDMHPADEFDAFKQLVDQGHSIGDVVARFGKNEIYIKQRLKLANVAPEILKDYREGKATLEQMMAMALTDDKAAQLRLWKGTTKADWQREPRRLREAITATEYSTTSRLGRFVGLATYEKAGGTVRRDLFADDDGPVAYLQDVELVERLVAEKLERSVAKVLADGWLWAEARRSFDYSDERQFGTIYATHKDGKSVWTKEAKATAGVIVTIDYNGQTEIKRGLIRPQDRKAAAAAAGGTDKVKGGKNPHVPGELTFAAVQRLQAEATGILQLEISVSTRTALALLAAELAGRELYPSNMYSDRSDDQQRQWVHIQRENSGRMPGNLRDVIPSSSAGKKFAAAEAAWKALLPKKKAELREWLLGQDFERISKLLAFLVARELDVVDLFVGKEQDAVDAAAAAKVDLSKHWTPSIEWLASLPKSVIVEMVTEAAGKVVAAPLAKMKRDQLPKAAIELLPAGWLPKPLRPKVLKVATKKAVVKKAAKPAKAKA